ncbi:MAG: thiolase domain-containing protein [Chloroflexi bacterium]|nr:thiolase domain-containing protein [Chloroflexota bacterium]
MVDLRKAAAIAGVYEHPTRYAPDKSELQIQAECAIGALEDAGLRKGDVDALFTSGGGGGLNAVGLADYLDMYPRFVDNTSVGGSSFEFHLSHALTAAATGRLNCALITYASTARSHSVPVGTGARGGMRLDPSIGSFEDLYGTTLIGLYALVAHRHMARYGTTSRQLAEISVAARAHAAKNPHAVYRDPITVEDVISSRMVSSPLRLLDCCIISDGGGAVVVVSPEVARNIKKRPVWVLGVGEAVAHQGVGARDLVETAAKQSAPRAFQMAGVAHSDIDMCMIYDSFTITVLTTLEDLGFCQKGEGGEFVSGGRLSLGGALPINTDGGGLSSNHPGMRGIFLLLEATKQLRGERGEMQVPDCRLALCHGTGGSLGARHSGGTVILGRD